MRKDLGLSPYRRSCRWRSWGNPGWDSVLSAATRQRMASSQWSPPACGGRTLGTRACPRTEGTLENKQNPVGESSETACHRNTHPAYCISNFNKRGWKYKLQSECTLLFTTLLSTSSLIVFMVRYSSCVTAYLHPTHLAWVEPSSLCVKPSPGPGPETDTGGPVATQRDAQEV